MRYTIVKESLKRGRTIETYNYAVKDTVNDRIVVRYQEDFKAAFVRDSLNEVNPPSRFDIEVQGNETFDDLDESAFKGE